MQITDITCTISKRGCDQLSPRLPRYAANDDFYVALLEIHTESGVVGQHGFGVETRAGSGYSRHHTYARVAEILGRIKPEIIGRSIHDRGWLWQEAYNYQWWGGLERQTMMHVDIAMWDAAGKAAGLPVHQLIGTCRTQIPAYASGPYLETAEEHAACAAACKAAGYPAFKIKPGGGSLAHIKRVTSAVRAAVGDDMALMIDGQMQFDVDQALTIGFHLQDLGFEWWEDCLRHNDLSGYELLHRKLHMPIAYTDHRATNFYDLAEFIRRVPDIRILRSDPGRDGITGLLRVCHLAESFGKRCEVHTSSPPALHVMFAINNCHYVEDTLTGKLDKASMTVTPLEEGEVMYVDPQGMMYAPMSPGVNKPVDWKAQGVDIVEVLR